MPTVRQIQMVHALVEHASFTQAARAIGITQSALTKSLQALESELDVRLFDRAVGPPTPTMFGDILLARGRTLIRDMSELVREIDLAKGLEIGRLTVSANWFPAEIWVPRALARLAAAHPKLQCTLRTDGVNALQDVMDGTSDVAIADAGVVEKNDDIVVEKFASSRLVIICRSEHPLARRKFVRPEELQDYPFVGPSLPKSYVRLFPGKLWRSTYVADADGRLAPRITLSNFSLMREAILHSDAIGWAPELLVGRDASRGMFRLLDTDFPGSGRVDFAFLTRRSRTLSPAATEFIKLVKAIQRGGANG